MHSEKGMIYKFNDLRVPWIIETIIKLNLDGTKKPKEAKPLESLKILDVGCGSGLVSESLAEYGGTIVGLDPCLEMIDKAKKHLALSPSLTNVTYLNETMEEHYENHLEFYDVVLAMEVLDHVDHPGLFLEMCCKCLKPGGPIFLATFNQTWDSWLIGIVLCKYIWGIIPRTHSWYKFITPENVSRILIKNNCKPKEIRGLWYNILSNNFQWSQYHGVHYSLYAIKDKE